LTNVLAALSCAGYVAVIVITMAVRRKPKPPPDPGEVAVFLCPSSSNALFLLMYDTLLDQPLSQYSVGDFEKAVGAASLPPDETHWVGNIPRMDGVFWTPGRFPKELEKDPAWLTQEAVTDSEVISLPVCMAEIDDGTFQEQGEKLNTVVKAGLPAPSAVVISGDPRVPGATAGKSLHLYWTLDSPFAISEVEKWKNVQRALIKALGSDPKILNPSRKMRVGGVAGIKRFQTLLSVGGVVTKADMEQWARGILGQKAVSSSSAFAGIASATSTVSTKDLRGDLSVTDGRTTTTIAEWWEDEQVAQGTHWNICCPEAGSKTAGSAFLVKEVWGVRMTCVAGHHGHAGASSTGSTGWVWHAPFLFSRGDDLEVAERVLEVDLGTDNVISTRSREYLYEDSSGVWVEDGLDGTSNLFAAVSTYGGHLVATANGVKELKMGNQFINCAIKNIGAKTHNPRFFDNRPEGVACKNGFLEPSGNIVPLDKKHRVRGEDVFPLHYSAGASCKRWLQFLEEIFEGDDDKTEKIDLVQEFVGACLFGKATEYQRHVILLGTKGANGKSVLLKTVKSLFPQGTVASCPMQDWTRPFGLSWVPGTLLNVITEMPEKDLLDSGPVKGVLSGDPRSIEEKYKSSYDAVPKAGHLLAANTMPFVADNTEAFYRRFMIIGFNRSFTRAEQDPSLPAKLHKELEGILAWAVQGYHRLKSRGDYVVPHSSEDLLSSWAISSDSVGDFALQHLVQVDGQSQSKGSEVGALYSVYREWCLDVGNRPVKQRNFSAGLSRCGFPPARGKRKGKYWTGFSAVFRSQGGLPRKARIAANVVKGGLLFLDQDASLGGTAVSFVTDWVKIDPKAWCSSTAIYEAYCRSTKDPQSKDKLGKALKDIEAKRKVKKINGKAARGWEVAFSQEVELPEEFEGQFVVDLHEEEV
tara:strand:+ start:2537 stop:5305 length:2769 start_codon:yes stop_codon:yes gene_type:complete